MPKRALSPDEKTLDKAARLEKLKHLLFRNPRGLTARELAGMLNVSVRQVQRDIETLHQSDVPVYNSDPEGEKPQYAILSGHFLPPVHFNLNEAAALYVAGRLLARYSDRSNPLIIQALAKLAGAMPQPIAEHMHNTVRSLAYKPPERQFARVFDIIITAWAERKKVRIWHQSGDSEHVHEYLLSPYFIEPSSTGYATYVIGHASYFDAIHTFKMERIHSAELTNASFDIPVDFDGAELLRDAWGVMYGETLVEVKLRFSPAVTRRVQESVWHPSQSIQVCEDGGCILTVKINHTLEMMPFIRAWGAQVEVLAPVELRDQIAEEYRRAVEIYAQPA